MALDNQEFLPKPIIALGASFFLDDTGQVSYPLCLQMREDEALRVAYDFHFLDMEQPSVNVVHVLDVLQGWGAPVVLGKIMPPPVNAKVIRSFSRIIVSVMKIHSLYLCNEYRYNGTKNLSTLPAEEFLLALSLAARDPDPTSLTKHLINVSRY